ncbi:UDP-glucuronosyl and UDP-glucosyl transferase [Handroanthus impetiginosus]|uniref:Glycosyltransferase n=1 Tax=Handroanthus impetiginosus TaxID=429701 RepID=A0A2G9GRT0_9LAMI|nr:UDP-glucuronosyl and UDP-glucosyl transferase [Handroanthus impetiginosus]
MSGLVLSDEPREIIHVFMVSFPGQGHVNPLLRLGKRLADFGLFITISAPEFAGQSIRKASKITDDEPRQWGRGMIRFEFFDDEWDLNDPNRSDLDSYVAQLERVGREKLPVMIRKQEEKGRPVSCLINNPFIPWVSDVAESLGIPSAMLWVQSCASFSCYYHYYNNLVPFPSEKEPEIDVQLPHMPLLKYDEIPSFLHPSTPYPFLGRAILGQFKNLSKPFCILMDTFQELEHDIIEYMSKISRPIKTIGPLFRPLKTNTTTANSNSNAVRADFYTADSCIDWLDSKPPRTVVYISFGSIVHPKQEQIDEIAFGLLSSEVTFLWVLRPPPTESKEGPRVLPKGFLEKVGEKGKVMQWAPQEEVLAHPSTACFVTHCGWNSTMEALTSGIPVVAFPQFGDQVTDAKFLVDVFKVGIRMGRGEPEGRIVLRDEVERCLRAATGGAEAQEMRKNAMKWKKAAEDAVVEGGSSYRNMQDFVDEVVGIGSDLDSALPIV